MTASKAPIPSRLGLPLACLAMALALVVWRYGALVIDAVGFPYELDYGEGIVWQQMRMIIAGQGYAPLGDYPAIVFHYPPLYHLLSAAMAGLTGLDQLAAGRLVSVLCTLVGVAMAGLVGTAVARPGDDRRALRIGGVCSAILVLSTDPVFSWSILFRVDMLFIALSFAGLWLGIRALREGWAVHGAALCFVGAIFTKQTALAAPLAVFAVLLVANPRRALAGMATGFGAAITALVAVTVWTHGGFLTHILAYNINRFALVNGLDILITFGMHFGMVAVAVVALLPRVNRLRAAARRDGGLAVHLRADAGDAALAMVLAYLALATMMMGLIFKSGSSINYFLEWLFLVGILAGWGIADFVAAEQAGRVVAALPWLLSLQVLAFCAFYETEFERREPFAGDYARIATVVRAAPGPVISDDMVLLLRSGKPVVIEPSIFAELSARKVIDDRTLLAEIRSRRISFVLTENDPGDPTFDARYTPAMTRAILTAYPQTVTLAERYRLRFPAGPLPVWAKALRTGNR